MNNKRKQLSNALDFLEETFAVEKNRVSTAAVVQAFEMALELSWKYLKAQLEEAGVLNVTSPKNVVRLAGEHGFLNEVERWIAFLEARNLTSHTYNQEVADDVYKIAKDFLLCAKKL